MQVYFHNFNVMKNLIYLLLSIILLPSCLENSPAFLEPQPSEAKNLHSFPKKLRGSYRIDEKENLSISKLSIIQWGTNTYSFSLAEIDTNELLILKNDSLYNLENDETMEVTIRNDSVFSIVNWKDTAFYISEKHILRKSKTHYILNESAKDSTWKVVRLQIIKPNKIELSTMDKKEELNIIKEYTTLYDVELKNDTIVNFSLKPTHKEFSLMLSSDKLFTEKEVYERIGK